MPRLKTALFGVAAVLAGAGSAVAQTPEWRTTTVDLPDGSRAQIRYLGDVPPQVTVAMPASRRDRAARTEDPIDAASGIPRARRVIEAPSGVPAPPAEPRLDYVFPADAPSGATYNYTSITFGADGRACVRRTDWTSRGRRKAPDVARTDSGDGCLAASAAPAAMAPAAVLPPPAAEPAPPAALTETVAPIFPGVASVPLIEPAAPVAETPSAAPMTTEPAIPATTPIEASPQPMPPTPALKKIVPVDPDTI